MRSSLLVVVGLFSTACGSSASGKSPIEEPTEGGRVCRPDTKFCEDGAVYQCNGTGSGSTLSEACDSTQYCIEADEDAACSDTPCKSGQPLCDGQVATICKEDGSGPEEGGTSCADANETCLAGACVEQECAPNRKFCREGDLYWCNERGSASLLHECSSGQACDEAVLACRPMVCEPGASSCDGSKVVTCNNFGTDRVGGEVDCASNDELCIDGACQEKCVPGSSYCRNDEVYACDAQGVGYRDESCSDLEYCRQANQTVAYCASKDCNAGEVTCIGNTVKTCTAEGRWPATGTDCGDQLCVDNACYPKFCEPYSRHCIDGALSFCERDGHFGDSPLICAPGYVCAEATDGSATCAPQPCAPRATSCLANGRGICADDGSSLLTTLEDCAATGTVCSPEGTCAASVVDNLGIEETSRTSSGGTLFGNVIFLASERKLTQLEASLVVATPHDLRWVVYEEAEDSEWLGSDIHCAPYRWAQRADKIVTQQSGSGFFSSGAFDFTLKAGKRYVVGVAWDSGAGLISVDPPPFVTEASFGRVLSGVSESYWTKLTWSDFWGSRSEALYSMRLTTTLP